MKISKILPIILCLCLIFPLLGTMHADALDEPDIGAGAVYLIETTTGQTFYEKNAHERMYPASLTKIMTILLVVEAVEAGEVSLDDQVTAQEGIFFDLESDGSSAGITVGETMSLENLIHCALLSSANEACNVLAEYVAGTSADFIARMNERAAELGCKETNFMNAHGLPNEEHYSSAYDIYLITREAMDHDLFERICNTDTVEIPATNKTGVRTLTTTNYLINPNSSRSEYYYEGASGVKTGYTSAAGYCLVSTLAKNDMNLICVVMGATSYDADGIRHIGSFEDTLTLYEWVFENYYYQDILRSSEIIAHVPISMGASTDEVPLRPENTISALLPADFDLKKFDREIEIYSERDNEELIAPINTGTVLGKITVTRDGHVYGTTNLVSASSVALSKSQYLQSEIGVAIDNPTVKTVFWILVVLIGLYLIFVLIYRIQRIRYLIAQKTAEKERKKKDKATQEAPAGNSPFHRLPFLKKKTENKQSVDTSAPPVFTPPVENADSFDEGADEEISDQTDAPSPMQESPETDLSEETFPVDEEEESPTAAITAENIPDAQKKAIDRDYFEEFFKHK